MNGQPLTFRVITAINSSGSLCRKPAQFSTFQNGMLFWRSHRYTPNTVETPKKKIGKTRNCEILYGVELWCPETWDDFGIHLCVSKKFVWFFGIGEISFKNCLPQNGVSFSIWSRKTLKELVLFYFAVNDISLFVQLAILKTKILNYSLNFIPHFSCLHSENSN